MQVEGGRLSGGTVDSYTDHRIAMAFAVAGLSAAAPVTIRDCVNVNTSFPGFMELLQQLGCDIASTGMDHD
jgi:3-phosphoshikimate 1-carboxyvinyltransferase